MKPWVHPQERRSRIFFSVQIVVGVVAMIVVPILLLREPTTEHIVIAVAVVLIGIVALIFSIRALKGLAHEYRSEEHIDDVSEGPGL